LIKNIKTNTKKKKNHRNKQKMVKKYKNFDTKVRQGNYGPSVRSLTQMYDSISMNGPQNWTQSTETDRGQSVRALRQSFEPMSRTNYGHRVKALRQKYEHLVQNQTTQTNYRQTFDRLLQKSQNQSIEALITRYESRDRMDQTYSGQRVQDLKQTFQRMPQTGQRVTVLRQKFEQIDLMERSDGLRNQTRSPKRDHGQRVRALSQIYEGMDPSSTNSSDVQSGLQQVLNPSHAFPNSRSMASTQYSQQPIQRSLSNPVSRDPNGFEIYGSRQPLDEDQNFYVNAVSPKPWKSSVLRDDLDLD
jgi:uncharacterized protein YheU (UPF0270 family)